MTIDEVFKLYRFIVNSVQSGKITPEQFNLTAVRAQLAWYEFHYKKYQKTQDLTDSLAPFVVRSTITVDADGESKKPDGLTITDTVTAAILPEYFHALGFRFNYVTQEQDDCDDIETKNLEIPIKNVDEDKLGDYLASEIVNPTKRFPIITQYATFFQFKPIDLQRVIFSYLKKPLAPNWAFTTDGNGRPVYDATNSVDFQAPDQEHELIILRMCDYAGIHLREGELQGFAERSRDNEQ